jgi:pimeloyl-ACP methyl ester carboxylesterase
MFKVVHVSGAKVLRDKLPNCQRMDIIPRCGHAINLDRPGSKTKALLSFRGEYSKKNQ